MGFFNKIAGLYNRVIQSMQDARDVAFNLPAKIEENSRLFKTIFNTNWSERTIEEMEEAVEEVKQRVIGDLIPAAGQLNLYYGVPGFIYIPCQITGALAIARIYDPKYVVSNNFKLTLSFEGNYQLVLKPDLEDDSGLAYWELLMPNEQILIVGPGLFWECKSIHEPY